MKNLQSVCEGILDADFDVKEDDLNIILSNIKDIHVYPVIHLVCTLDGDFFHDELLKDLKKSLQKSLPIRPNILKYLPKEYKPDKKYEAIGQIVNWMLYQNSKELHDVCTSSSMPWATKAFEESFRKEMLTRYGAEEAKWCISVDYAWGEYYIHLCRTSEDMMNEFCIMKFTMKK